MTELTEQQEQEMIEKAKAGDPEANYNMSLWALEQAMAEPDEERWNRLAAKCLVRAAEAGYEPAKAKMDELLHAAEAKNAEAAKSERPAAAPSRPAEKPVRPASGKPRVPSESSGGSSIQFDQVAEKAGKAAKAAGKAAVKAGTLIAAGASSLARKAKTGLIKASESKSDRGESGGSHRTQKKPILPDFSQWDDAQWKKMQIICVIACVVLAILIAILIISSGGRKKKTAEVEEIPQIPVAEVAATPVPTPTPAPVAEPDIYPDQATRDEIQAASLSVYPSETEYVDQAKTVTANVNEFLNMRDGPGTNYTQVASIPARTQLSVYAYKNGWALLNYNGTWGWCSNDYLINAQ